MKHHKAPSQRQLRMGEEVRHALAYFLSRGVLRDPLLEPLMLTVSEVRMTPDLKLATCFIAPPEAAGSGSAALPETEAVIQALNRHAKFIRGQLSGALRGLKYMPEFRFRADTSFDNFAKIDALLRSPEVARDLQADDAEKDE